MVGLKAQARARLDNRLERYRALAHEPRPHRGWIRAIRDALGMTRSEMAARMGVGAQSIPDIERSEERDTIKLETLRRAADALDCDVIYLLVPRQGLVEAVRAQARRKAAQVLGPVAHHSRLEDQMVSSKEASAQLDELAAGLADRRGLWTEGP
jgi:predicted DNA-binding mobile mystery protein A